MLQVTYNALVRAYFNYCSPLWDNCRVGLNEKLQEYQNREARTLTAATYNVRTADVFKTLAWQYLRKSRDSIKFLHQI